MFSNQKKSFFKSKLFYGCVIVLLIAFGIWLNYDPADDETAVNSQTKVEQTTPTTNPTSNVVDSLGQQEQTSEPEIPTEVETQEPTQETYFLVREVDGVIKIFYCNEKGEESLFEITTIPFSLLSKEDQQLFAEGVHLKTQDELERFLENFDS